MRIKKSVLDGASVEELLKLKSQISERIEKYISAERDQLQKRLDKLDALPMAGDLRMPRRRQMKTHKTRKVPIKFRNPTKRNETWSGRGRTPRWLVATMKSTGKKLDDFRI